jgi:cytochrome c oxidase cbb3-type subunit 3
MANIEKDEVSGTETTGHEWDGIKELDTPLPNWWRWTFYATVIWGLGYTIAYPAWPLLTGATPGVLGYSSRQDVANEIAAAASTQAQWTERIRTTSLEDILKDEELLRFAKAGGAAAFRVSCVQCHGSGAAGFVGYPNLNDNDWLWGGTVDQIHQTITNGIRFTANAETRDSQMPAFGDDGMLTGEQIGDVANFVVQLSGGQADQAAAVRGAQVFTDNCVACHGEKGEGNKELGAPNLADQISLYGGDLAALTAQIAKPRHGVMPAWADKLDEVKVKELAVFVHALGGGEQAAAAP